MNGDVLRRHEIEFESTIAAKLTGFELSVTPRANLRKRNGFAVYGSVVLIGHRYISRLYGDLESEFGIAYHPFPVLAKLRDDTSQAALCYISFDEHTSDADPRYVIELAECAKALNAPDEYIRHIMSFATKI